MDIERMVNLEKSSVFLLAATIGAWCLDAALDVDRGVVWVRKNLGALGLMVAVAHATTEVMRGSLEFHELIEEIYDQLEDEDQDDPMIGGAICDFVSNFCPVERGQVQTQIECRDSSDPLRDALEKRLARFDCELE